MTRRGYYIELTFVERFDIETSTDCENDFLQVRVEQSYSLSTAIIADFELLNQMMFTINGSINIFSLQAAKSVENNFIS